MAGFVPPSPPGTRVRASGEGQWLSGDVELAGGVAIHPRHRTVGDQGIVLDSVGPNAMHPSGLFIPGTLTVREVARFANLGTGAAQLGYLELNAYTAPAGVDNLNHRAIRVSGVAGGAQQLGLTDDGVSYYAYNGRTPVTVLGHTADISTMFESGHSVTGSWAQKLATSSNVVVSGAGFARRAATTNTDPDGKVRAVLMDPGMTEYLAVSEYRAWTDITPSNAEGSGAGGGPSRWNYFAFDRSVDVAQGTEVVVGFEVTHAPEPNVSDAYIVRSGSTGDTFVGGPRASTPDRIDAAFAEPGSLIGKELDKSTFPYLAKATGAPNGVDLTGSQIVVEVVDVGTPPATPGDDVNVRLGFYFSEE